MSNIEPTEVQLARLDEKLKQIVHVMEKEQESRKYIYNELKTINHEVTIIKTRVESVEENLARTEPTIEEFITIKHKVVGAGIAGKWMWAVAGALIGIVWSARKEIGQWLNG